MNKGMTKNTKLRLIFVGLIATTLIGSFHIWSPPEEYLGSYFIAFTILYSACVMLSIAMIIILKGVWYKVAASINLAVALLVLADDVFMVVISGASFLG